MKKQNKIHTRNQPHSPLIPVAIVFIVIKLLSNELYKVTRTEASSIYTVEHHHTNRVQMKNE